jgi:hypothetical protein
MVLKSTVAAAVVAAAVIAAPANACLRPLSVERSLEKNGSVVSVIKHQQPPPVLLIAQPVVHQLKHVRLRVLAPADLDQLCYLLEALLQPRRVAGVRP